MVKYDAKDGRLVCEFPGNMDTESCHAISDELLSRIAESKTPIVFDMRNVDYVASIFLGLCISVAKKVGRGSFSFVNIRPNVRKVFKIAKLDTLLTID
jgi:anti-anti-sigma factor